VTTPITDITTATEFHTHVYQIPNDLFTDPDGDSLTVTLDLSGITPALSGTESVVHDPAANTLTITVEQTHTGLILNAVDPQG